MNHRFIDSHFWREADGRPGFWIGHRSGAGIHVQPANASIRHPDQPEGVVILGYLIRRLRARRLQETK